MIAAGSLDQRITLQQQVVTQNAMGTPIPSYVTQYQNIPAAVKPVSGKEKYHSESDRLISYKVYSFTIRFIDGINERHRIQYDGADWDIISISDIGRREGLILIGRIAK